MIEGNVAEHMKGKWGITTFVCLAAFLPPDLEMLKR